MKPQRTFNDLSQLGKLKIEPGREVPRPAVPVRPAVRSATGKDPHELFASMAGLGTGTPAKRTAGRGVVRPTSAAVPSVPSQEFENLRKERDKAVASAEAGAEERKKLQAEKDALLQRVAALEESLEKRPDERQVANLREENERLAAWLDSARKQLAAKQDEIDAEVKRLQGELDATKRALEAEQAKQRGMLLSMPAGVEEVFPGETREQVIETLRYARDRALDMGCDRGVNLLSHVLAVNTPTGELQRRAEEVEQILRDAGKTISNTSLRALEKLGFTRISTNKHHKLRWGNVTITLAVTPSDYRSVENMVSDICRRVF